jgi:hypothetical protein
MGFGVSIKLAPGVRVRASTRGVRASVGPRAARVHVGSGRTRISSGVGPFTVSSGLGVRQASPRRASTSGSRSTGGQRVTLAHLERQARAAERAQQIADIAALEEQLTGLHREDFAPTQHEVLPDPTQPAPADVATLRRDLTRTALAGISWFHRAERRNAKAAAAAAATDLARRQHVAAIIAAQRAQVDLDESWDALGRHDPDTVIEAVDAAFADNASESTCVDAGHDDIAGGRYVTCVVLFGTADLIPDHRPALTPGGKPTLRKRTKTDRNALYTQALASTVLATVKEALAVAVAADQTRILVVRQAIQSSPATQALEVVYLGTFHRDRLQAVDWASVNPIDQLLSADGCQLNLKGSTREVVPVSTEDEPGLQVVLSSFRTSLHP